MISQILRSSELYHFDHTQLTVPLPDYATISLFNPRYEALREREGQTASQLNGHELSKLREIVEDRGTCL